MEMMKELGTPHISNGLITYTNEISGRKFFIAIAKTIKYEIWEELSDATAFGVMIDEKSITKVLKILSKLVAFASVGASVMLGKNESVAAELSRVCTYPLIVNHCVAHRLALACKDARKDIDFYKD
ncbi:hypothetical protein C1646_766349 [Rhizophagus diaphanus]|nr:hypothetical protein C1646_766349 [Rhizophagus diaphanus] [Rhizophagus sp. MUCL 43196]